MTLLSIDTAHAQTYPSDRSLSPLTPRVVQNLRRIAGSRSYNRDNMIIKVGDSSTVNAGFMHCFGQRDIELDGRNHLNETIDFFRGYTRQSQAAGVGWSSVQAIQGGSDAPLNLELRDLRPRFALLMFGTNDIEGRDIQRYGRWMWQIVDRIEGRGTIPILSTMPPRNDDAEADGLVPEWNLVVRALASHLRYPMIDLHREMIQIPGDRGLARDGYHPSTYWTNRGRGCVFTDDGLRNGQNVRNLLNIEMLHRLRQTVIGSGTPPDAALPSPRGTGTADAPFMVPGFPYTNIADFGDETSSLNGYGCEGARDEDGPEHRYRFTVSQRSRVTFVAIPKGRNADVQLYLLSGSDAGQCTHTADRRISEELNPGTYTVVVETRRRGRGASADRYMLLAL